MCEGQIVLEGNSSDPGKINMKAIGKNEQFGPGTVDFFPGNRLVAGQGDNIAAIVYGNEDLAGRMLLKSVFDPSEFFIIATPEIAGQDSVPVQRFHA